MTKSKSLIILENKINNLFTENNENCVVFSDNCNLEWPSEEIINIVFFGNALTDLMFLKILPKKTSYIVWVLCTEFKLLINKFYNIPIQSIKVINRYDLFPKNENIKNFNIEEINNWVIASRPSSLKNIELSYRLLNQLGRKNNQTINIEVCAPNYKISDFERYNKGLEKLNIIYRGDLGPNWVDYIENIENKALIQLSFYPKDDFSVSVAQWQQKNGSLLLSNTIACKDVYGTNVYKLHFEDLYKIKRSGYNNNDLKSIFKTIFRDNNRSTKFFEDKVKAISRESLITKIRDISDEYKDMIYKLNSHELNQSIIKIHRNDL